MEIRLVSFTTHDGKSTVKINPQQVNYLDSQEDQYTKIHFGPNQTVDVIGDLDTVAATLTRP